MQCGALLFMPFLSMGFFVQKHQEAEEQEHTNGKTTGLPADFDPSADRHKGELALRKLYHESDRLLVVLYTSPTCGPCRTLKPIFNKVADEFSGKVSLRKFSHPVKTLDIALLPNTCSLGICANQRTSEAIWRCNGSLS